MIYPLKFEFHWENWYSLCLPGISVVSFLVLWPFGFGSQLSWPIHSELPFCSLQPFPRVQKTASAFVRQVTFKFPICCPSEFFLDGILGGKRGEKRNFLIHAHAWYWQNLYSLQAVHVFAARPGSLSVMTCGPRTASSSMLAKAYMAGRASCSLAICIHLFSKKTRLQGGLLLSTLQMLLCTDSTYSLCASPFPSFTGIAVGWVFGACFSWKKDQEKKIV